MEVVNYYICGLKAPVQELVAQKVRLIQDTDEVNLDAVKQAAVDIGKFQRALSSEEEPRTD